MKSMQFRLSPNKEQEESLKQLQKNFAEVCNAIYEVVQESKCWGRVALHHMVYHQMRQKFPMTGSQMICNAIYAVARTARIVFEQSESPWYQEVKSNGLLPKIIFLQQSPIFFDSHTVNFTKDRISIYTLSGRIHFDIKVSDVQKSDFLLKKFKEILLLNHEDDLILKFVFSDAISNSGKEKNVIDFPKSIIILNNNSEDDVNYNKVAC